LRDDVDIGFLEAIKGTFEKRERYHAAADVGTTLFRKTKTFWYVNFYCYKGNYIKGIV